MGVGSLTADDEDATMRDTSEKKRDSIATPNFNSLITGARATSCQGARIFQTIVFVNPSGLARARQRIYARTYIHINTRSHEYTPTHPFRIYDEPLFAWARTYRLLSSRIPFLRIALGLPTSLPNVPESTLLPVELSRVESNITDQK